MDKQKFNNKMTLPMKLEHFIKKVTRENDVSIISVISFIPLKKNIECHKITYKKYNQ